MDYEEIHPYSLSDYERTLSLVTVNGSGIYYPKKSRTKTGHLQRAAKRLRKQRAIASKRSKR